MIDKPKNDNELIWTVQYRFEGEEVETMIVDGADIETAIREAHYSLSAGETPYKIFGAWRDVT